MALWEKGQGCKELTRRGEGGGDIWRVGSRTRRRRGRRETGI